MNHETNAGIESILSTRTPLRKWSKLHKIKKSHRECSAISPDSSENLWISMWYDWNPIVFHIVRFEFISFSYDLIPTGIHFIPLCVDLIPIRLLLICAGNISVLRSLTWFWWSHSMCLGFEMTIIRFRMLRLEFCWWFASICIQGVKRRHGWRGKIMKSAWEELAPLIWDVRENQLLYECPRRMHSSDILLMFMSVIFHHSFWLDEKPRSEKA